MSSGHHILKCKMCNIVISQCRCMASYKEVRLTVCAECKEKLAKEKLLNTPTY